MRVNKDQMKYVDPIFFRPFYAAFTPALNAKFYADIFLGKVIIIKYSKAFSVILPNDLVFTTSIKPNTKNFINAFF